MQLAAVKFDASSFWVCFASYSLFYKRTQYCNINKLNYENNVCKHIKDLRFKQRYLKYIIKVSVKFSVKKVCFQITDEISSCNFCKA